MNRWSPLIAVFCALLLLGVTPHPSPDAESVPAAEAAESRPPLAEAAVPEGLVRPAGLTETIRRAEAYLFGESLRAKIPLNNPVKAELDDWLTWRRPLLLDAYENYAYLREDIAPIYAAADLPEPLLFAMIATETGGKVHATSRAGASGLLQFMRYTGKKYGLDTVDGFDQRFDPVRSTQANVDYLRDRFAEFNNDLEKALAAYNGGEGRLGKLHRRHGEKSLWESDFYYALPRETREYVPRIFAAALLFMHPEEYGLEFPEVDTTRAPLVVQRDTSLSELTICLGQRGSRQGWFRAIRNLNPTLKPEDRISEGTTLTVPRAVAEIYGDACLDDTPLMAKAFTLWEANYPDEPEMVRYTVRRGDTLSKIASKFRCTSLRQLASINGVRGPRYVIHVGQRLKVPSCG